jgi:hypothetical protein
MADHETVLKCDTRRLILSADLEILFPEPHWLVTLSTIFAIRIIPKLKDTALLHPEFIKR